MGQPIRLKLVENPVPFLAFMDQFRVFEDREMSRHRRTGHLKQRGNLPGRHLARLEFLENLPPRGVGQRFENMGGEFHMFKYSYLAK